MEAHSCLSHQPEIILQFVGIGSDKKRGAMGMGAGVIRHPFIVGCAHGAGPRLAAALSALAQFFTQYNGRFDLPPGDLPVV